MKTKDKISVGLDIGTQVVKLVKLRFIQEVVELVDFALEPMQAEPIEVLKKLKISHGLEAVNIAFSGPATVIRDINFPKMSAAELKQALKFEVQKHIPFPVAEVNLDGCILKDDLPDNKMLVLLAAVKKEYMTLDTLLSLLCERPAQLLNLSKGKLEVGRDADFIIVDMKKTDSITAEHLHSRCGWTPFEGQQAIFPSSVYIRGEKIIEDKAIQVKQGFGKPVGVTHA